MPTQTFQVPLPFDDAVIVLQGRMLDARLDIEYADVHRRGPHDVQTWVVSTPLGSPVFGGAVAALAAPSLVFVQLVEKEGGCECAVIAAGLPALGQFAGFLLDLGSGLRAGGALSRPAAHWVADER